MEANKENVKDDSKKKLSKEERIAARQQKVCKPFKIKDDYACQANQS